MTYLLDTNMVIALLNGRPAAVRDRYEHATERGSDLAVSSIVLFELWYGAAKSSRPKDNAERLRIFMSGGVDVLAFEDADAEVCGRLRATLEAAGTPIGAYDVQIAGQALRHGTTLVTANVAEFARVPELRWENWTAEKSL